MISLSLQRNGAFRTFAVSVCVLALLLLLVSPSLLTLRLHPSENLRSFEGVIDHRKQTYDHIKSALYVRASRSLTAGDDRGAEAVYREIIARYPGEPDGYEALGACLVFEDKYADAAAEYQRALQLNPRSVDALYGLGCVGYKQRRNPEAKDYLERALELDPNNALCHRVLGSVYEQMGDTPQAVSHYERAVALDPTIAGDALIKQKVEELKQ